MPARIGDTRTPAQKEEESKKAIYRLMKEEFQSWGTLKRVARQQGMSTATLAKYLKNFVKTGIVIKKEEPSEKSRLPRTYYRLTSQKPLYGDITERAIYMALKRQPPLEFSEEEMRVWGFMGTALKIFAYELANALAVACEKEPEQVVKFMETILDVRLKDRIRELVKIFYTYREVKNGTVPIASFVAESFMIEAEESAESWVPKSWIKNFGYLPEPAITIAWILLTSENQREALKKIKEEMDAVEEAISNSLKKDEKASPSQK